MKVEFKLTEEVLLHHQLFAASKSKRIQKRRAKGKMFILLMYMALGLFIWSRNGVLIGGAFFVICLPLYFLYAYMDKKQYINHFRVYVREQFKELMNQTTTLIFSAEQIEMTDGENESIIPTEDIETIHETGTFFSIILKNGQSILIPKENVMVTSDLISYFRELSDRLDIAYQQDLKWSWK